MKKTGEKLGKNGKKARKDEKNEEEKINEVLKKN